ncbi:AsmA family protein [mine drainage metagenome]|uniref:AsmA family protein n=1 Tax=mine drainage metagenome TaxID=410659 RepID=A0A1J5S4X4_9ZZZZ
MTTTTASRLRAGVAVLLFRLNTRRRRRAAAITAALLLLVGALGFFAAPPLIRHAAERQLSQALHRPAHIGHVAFNPYTLRLEVDDLGIGARTGPGQLLGIAKLVVRVSWGSLFRLAPIISEIRIEQPRLTLVRDQPQHFNISDLIADAMAPSAAPAAAAPAPLPRFALSNIQLDGGSIHFDDQVLHRQHVIDQWSLHIPFLANLPTQTGIFVQPRLSARIDGSPLELTARSKPFLPSLDSTLSLTLRSLDLPPLLSYAPVPLPVALPAGRLSCDLTLHFRRQGDSPEISLSGSVDVEAPRLTTPDGAPLLSAQALHVTAWDLEPLRQRLHFNLIRLDQPVVDLVRRPDGRLRLPLPAAAPATTGKAAAAPAAPLDLSIQQAVLNDGTLHFADAAPHPAAALSLNHLNAALSDFALTAATPAAYSLSASLGSGGTVALTGSLRPAAGQTQLHLTLQDLALAPLHPYLSDAPVDVLDGRLGLSLDAAADWSKPALALRVAQAALQMKALHLTLPERRALTITQAALSLDGLDVAAPAPASAAAPRRGRGHRRAARTPPAPGWRYRLDTLSLQKANLTFADHGPRRPVTLTLAPLSLTVRQISDDLSHPLPITLAAAVNHKGSLTLQGTLAPAPLSAQLAVDSKGLDLAPLSPYLDGVIKATAASAFFDAHGHFSLRQRRHALQAAYGGEAALVKVRLLDQISADAFAGWRRLALSGLRARYDSAQGADIHIGRVLFSRFYGHALLDGRGRLRLQEMLAHDEPAARRPEAEVRPAPAAAVAPPLRLAIGKVVLDHGRATYTDDFIKPHYTAHLDAISGSIGAFGTGGAPPAPVDIHTQLTANGPIAITGTVNPLAAAPSLDLTATARNIELTNLTPYSAKYAGYPITKGQLNVDLHYQLANNQLSADNHIFINQLTFGEHVDNSTATSLPVRLAVDLLKDPEGRIDVDIPVSGSLDSPDFSLGGLLWQAFVNLLEKAVTSPFSLLSHAFGGSGGEDLGYVLFTPGAAELSDAATHKLDTIAHMLTEKPGLSLEISGRVDPASDLPGLRSVYVQTLVKRQKLNDLMDRGGSIDPAKVRVAPDEYSKYLRQAYRNADFKRPRNLIGLLKSLPDAEMAKALADHTPLTAASLADLAQARAQAVRQYLGGKIDPARIFIIPPHLNAEGIADKGAPNRADVSLK